MPPRMKPLVIIPVLNEAGTVASLITEAVEYCNNCDVLIVDGGSTDGTISIVEGTSSEFPNVRLFVQSGVRRGYGDALAHGFQVAIQDDYDPIITMDADGSHDPVYIPDLLTHSEDHDLVIGSRYINGVRVEGWRFRKLLMSKLGNMFVSYVLVKPIWDFTSGYRCYRRRLVEQLRLEALNPHTAAAQIQLVHFAFHNRYMVKEIPVIFRERKFGRSKFGGYPKWRAFFTVLKHRAPLLEIIRHLTYLHKEYERYVEEYEELLNPARLKNGGAFELKEHYDVSVGVMAHNEEEMIGRCLEGLLSQEIPNGKIVEIIVVSSGSTDETNEIVRRMSQVDPRVKLITQNARLGKASAINEYLADACGDILILESADTFTEPDTVANLIEPFSCHKTGVVGAHPIPVNDDRTFVGYCVHKLWDLHHQLALCTPKCGEMIAFRNLIVRIPEYTAVDEAAIESIFAHHGFTMAYAGDAIVHNKGPENVREFVRQRKRIAAGHRHLRASTGHEVATQSARRIFRFLVKGQSLHPKLLFYTGLLIFIEAVSRMLGGIDYYLRDRNPFIWDISQTTKRM